MPSHEKLLCPLDEKADREIANQGLVVEYLADFVGKGRTRITEEVLSEIHRLTIQGIYPCAGKYRDALTKGEITDTDHKPSHPSKVKSDVRDMLEWLYGPGKHESPLKRAAHVLWSINAIHPFMVVTAASLALSPIWSCLPKSHQFSPASRYQRY